MIGKNTAVFYTFLWGLAYGFIVSIILCMLTLIMLPSVISSINDPSKSSTNLGMFNVLGVISFIASIGVIYLTYSKCYSYGLKDCENEKSTIME
jgi:uncharacterized protein with PQ loop repeat